MADEREGAQGPRRDPANQNTLQTGGRDANAAKPLNTAPDRGGPERYPAVDRTDAVERTGPAGDEARSFDPAADAPTPRQGAGDSATNEGRLGAQGDPAEGKR